MKILYAIQGTGNGHLARASQLVPELQKRAQVDVLVSGTQGDLSLPFDVKFHLHGLSFIFGKKGGIDYFQTIRKMKLLKFFKEIISLPLNEYDLIISDFEPVSSWASKWKRKQLIGLSHQAALQNKNVPYPRKSNWLGSFILKYYAPAKTQFGFHFDLYDKRIFTPIIREDIRFSTPVNEGHYTVYLPAFGNKLLINILNQYPETTWHVFSKHATVNKQVNNVLIKPIQNKAFVKSVIGCSGVLCGAGFETPAEALFLGKKLMVVPMKNQYEQQYNAAALQDMGIPVLDDFVKMHKEYLGDWISSTKSLRLHYSDQNSEIIDTVLNAYSMPEALVNLSDITDNALINDEINYV